MFPVAILSGGLATRLGPLTKATPKSLLEIAGQPFLAHQLRLLRRAGAEKVVICAGHLGEQIRDYCGDGSRFGLQVEYSFDGDTLLGTGGALKRALPLLGQNFFVLYGDSYLPCDYRAIQNAFAASGKKALMTVHRNVGKWDASNVEFRDGRILAYDKRNRNERMQYIDYGLGAFRQEAFGLVPSGQPYDLANLYQELLGREELAGFDVPERFYEIGSLQGIQEFTEWISDMNFSARFLAEARQVTERLDVDAIENTASLLARTKAAGGRLFILGVGGSAANASHAVNDFRKIVGLETYAPTDNVSELTARTNDEGWATVFVEWLKTSRLRKEDAVLVLSVGGGNLERNVSPNLVTALQYAKSVEATVLGIVGRDGGYTASVADACVIIPTVSPEHITPHSEAFQAVVWHLLVSHPALKEVQTKWESVGAATV